MTGEHVNARCTGGSTESHVGPRVSSGPHGENLVRLFAAPCIPNQIAQGVNPLAIDQTCTRHAADFRAGVKSRS